MENNGDKNGDYMDKHKNKTRITIKTTTNITIMIMIKTTMMAMTPPIM